MPLPEQRVLEQNGNQDHGEPSAQPLGVELQAAIRADLLDPVNWQEGLATFAGATNLAVALADAAGRLIGSTINPRPTWSLLHSKTSPRVSPSEGEVGCPFSLARLQPCRCVADALARGGVVVARDRTGLVHFAVPLVLGAQPLGALVAGQVFTQYPDQMQLEHIARQLLLSPGKAWNLARLEHPIKQADLEVYADLLATFGQNLLQSRYHTLMEADRLAEMTRLRDLALAEVAQRMQAVEALKEADRRKDEFLATLAHELRNPLAPISNALHLIRSSGWAEEIVRQMSNLMERQVEHLVRLVDDLLDVSRITRGKIQLRQRQVDLATVVAQAIEGSRPLIDARRQALEVTLPAEPLPLHADMVRLTQVVLNVLNNAAKFTPEGGRIGLTVEREEGAAVVRVRDTGMGIHADMLPHVFDLFTQAEQTLDRSEGGLGIGLTLVRRLTEMHGGTVEAFSEGLGQGSEFAIRLPLAVGVPPYVSSEESPRQEAPIAPVHSHRVLVVDDNRDSADSLAELLRLFGNDVRTAFDGRQALAVAGAYSPDVVLLDIGLPGMDGLEVCRRMRQKAGLETALIVAMTGYGLDADKRHSSEAGFDAHLVKPVDLDALQKLLASLEH